MAAPGWYPDNNVPGSERYWDGAQWTDHSRPVAQPHSPPPPQWGTAPVTMAPSTVMPAEAKKKNWIMRHKVLSGVGAVLLLGGIASASGGGDPSQATLANSDSTVPSDAPEQPAASSAAQPPAATKAAQPPAATKAAAPEKPKETSGQRNAKRAAENYLSFAPFSRLGLIQQLSSDAGDGYSVADATYAVDSLKIDFNEQAYKAAKKYLDFTAFSRQGLIEQLSSSAGDNYTKAQATYGADKALAES
jgi:hypothetical protein